MNNFPQTKCDNLQFVCVEKKYFAKSLKKKTQKGEYNKK